MMGEYVQFYPLMALAVIQDYDLDKALDFSFSGKATVKENIGKAPLDMASSAIEKVALAVVWFTAIDGGKGDAFPVDSIGVEYENFIPFLHHVQKWMKHSL
ncbi:MAG: hypothetical protein JW874_00100 [Spirochaetales bacterium]|nr:hypothetical protein [Spirochaetales bacterium]